MVTLPLSLALVSNNISGTHIKNKNILNRLKEKVKCSTFKTLLFCCVGVGMCSATVIP